MPANQMIMDPSFLAQLHAALDSVETTRSLLGDLRARGNFRSERPELRGAADLIGQARQAIYALIRAPVGGAIASVR